MQQGLNS